MTLGGLDAIVTIETSKVSFLAGELACLATD